MRKNGKVTGYLHTDGRWMVNGDNEKILLRGWGTGNWMTMEGYMVSGIGHMYGMAFDAIHKDFYAGVRFDRSRTVTDVIRDLCGQKYADSFWSRWIRHHLTEADIRAMAGMGCNSVRLALNGELFLENEPELTFNEDTFEVLDRIIDLCEKYGLYAILDLHAAPGGQTGAPCDNGLDNRAHMFFEPETRERTIRLWEEFARRYQNRWIVGGFELLNEPLATPAFLNEEPRLRSFYEETIARIRAIDRNHMIILMANQFGHNMGFFDRPFDPECGNWCYSVHDYWKKPDLHDFYHFLEPSWRLNVPCWYGEGRSTRESLAVLYEMLSEFGVGFNLFCWKYVDNETHDDNGFCYFKVPEGWEKVMRYIDQGGARPSYEESARLVDAWIEATDFERCTARWDYAPYVNRQPGISLPAVGYDTEGGDGVSFHGNWREGNVYSFRQEDHMKMVVKPGGRYPSHFERGMRSMPGDEMNLVLSAGEFASYCIHDVNAACSVYMKLRAAEKAVIEVKTDQTTGTMEIPAGEYFEELQIARIEPTGYDKVYVSVLSGSIEAERIRFAY